jgi:hypothetical protein
MLTLERAKWPRDGEKRVPMRERAVRLANEDLSFAKIHEAYRSAGRTALTDLF